MLRIVFLLFLWIYGLMPTAISLLMVIAMAGRPVPCVQPSCTQRTYSWELLVLPLATASPFICGFFIARICANKKDRHFKSAGGSSEP